MDGENGLFPVVEIPDYDEDGEDQDSSYRPSLAWDIEKGDLVQTRSHDIVQSGGIEAYKVWCMKAVHTERFSCLAYDDDMGTEMGDALSEEDEDAVELAVERTIEEALMVDLRTEEVGDFEFTWDTDHLHVSFTVTAEGHDGFTVETDIDI